MLLWSRNKVLENADSQKRVKMTMQVLSGGKVLSLINQSCKYAAMYRYKFLIFTLRDKKNKLTSDIFHYLPKHLCLYFHSTKIYIDNDDP